MRLGKDGVSAGLGDHGEPVTAAQDFAAIGVEHLIGRLVGPGTIKI